ncbi:acetyl-CoA carboxylase carboxyltransferase subunit beta [candidate division KSB1 bacterium]|nr:acetyl-CoA carboxylase carboxyltransferase subunit beta [candidate division KSB1 bacterium]
MDWFKRATTGLRTQKKREMPDGLWIKCDSCGEIIFKKELARHLYVCPKCGNHFRISSANYLAILLDEGTFEEIDSNLKSTDPLGFKDTKRYVDRLKEATLKTGMTEAVRTGYGQIFSRKVVFGVMDFSHLGGSVGSVVGEKIGRAVDRAYQGRLPLIVVSASGGMRMQEGVVSLMQMAKTSAKLARMAESRVPYISVLTNPTTGGTTASFAMLGDIIIAEPKALIGFAGPRVIKQTIGQDLPEGFQRSEFLLEHGFIDFIVERKGLKKKLGELLNFFDH